MKHTRKMSCGACGHDKFNIEADNSDFPRVLIFKCLKCKSTTIYTIATPHMVLDWGKNSQGVTCFMGKE